MHGLLIKDFGPGFIGFRGEVDGRLVCVATPAVKHDPEVRAVIRELIRRQGGDCDSCRGCPIGTSDWAVSADEEP